MKNAAPTAQTAIGSIELSAVVIKANTGERIALGTLARYDASPWRRLRDRIRGLGRMTIFPASDPCSD